MINIKNIYNASNILNGIARQTPILSSKKLNELVNGNVYLKAENEQYSGSFKLRGAYYCMHQILKTHAYTNVVACSSGNHAQGVALAASLFGLKATIVMPNDAPEVKIKRTKDLGAEIIFYDRYNESREAIAEDSAVNRNAFIIPPYDDYDVMAGQGTVALEAIQQLTLIEEIIDNFICPIGGGGLIAGCSIAFSEYLNDIDIFGVEPELLNDTQQSLNSGKRIKIDINQPSLCDALMAPTPGELTFSINQGALKEICIVSDDEVIDAIRFAYNEWNITIEPGGAVGLALILSGRFITSKKNTLIILSGGNIDPLEHQNLIK